MPKVNLHRQDTTKPKKEITHEKLVAINYELQEHISQLTKLNSDLNNILACIDIGIIFLDEELKLTRFTPSIKAIVDLDDPDIGKPIHQCALKTENPNFFNDVEYVHQHHEMIEKEVRLSNDQYYWMRILPYKTTTFGNRGVVITFTDITEKVKIQQPLAESRKRHHFLMENLPAIICEIKEDGTLVFINHPLPYLEKEIQPGSNFFHLLPSAKKNTIKNSISQVIQQKRVIEFEVELKVSGLSIFWLCRALPVKTNKHFNVILTCIDITDRKQAQQALIRSEEKYRLLFDNMISGFALHKIITDKKGKPVNYLFLDINSTFERLTGLKRNEVIGKTVLDVLPGIERKWINNYGKVALKGGSMQFIEYSKELNKCYQVSAFSPKKNYFATLFIDVTQQKRAEKLLKENIALYRSLFSESPLGICTFDSTGKIVDANQELINILGSPSIEETMKINIFKLPLLIKSGFTAEFKRCFKTGKRFSGIRPCTSAWGKRLYLKYNLAPLYNENNEVYIAQAIFENYTNRMNIEEELIRAKEKAEESDRLKSVFLTNISHEIRTPMNAILGFSNLISKDDLSEERKRKYAEIIKRNGKQLINLIDDILDISQIELRQVSIDREEFSLNALLTNFEIQFNQEKIVKNKPDISIQAIIPHDTAHDLIYSDPLRLRQIFTNLLGNALKFTHTGFIEFGYEFKEGEYLFFVKDTGVGIAKDKQDIVFERFRQEDEAINKEFGGAGLGLTITKALVTILGGIIGVVSEKGKGSTFYFNLPWLQKPTEIIKHGILEDIQKMYDFSGKTVLLAEDDVSSYDYFKEILEETKVYLLYAKNGKEALEIFKNHADHIDLILLDIQMPVLNGYEVAKQIRAVNNSVPILAQTAYAMKEEEQKCYQVGCTDYLTKPIKAGHLLGKMEKLLKI